MGYHWTPNLNVTAKSTAIFPKFMLLQHQLHRSAQIQKEVTVTCSSIGSEETEVPKKLDKDNTVENTYQVEETMTQLIGIPIAGQLTCNTIKSSGIYKNVYYNPQHTTIYINFKNLHIQIKFIFGKQLACKEK